jgi:hypothetical protein
VGGINSLPTRELAVVQQQGFLLYDLNSLSPKRVLGYAVSAPTRLFLFVLQNAAKPKFWSMLCKQKTLLEEVGHDPDGLKVLSNLLWYMRKVTPDMTLEKAVRAGQMAGLDSEIWKPIPGTWEWRNIEDGRTDGVKQTLSMLLVKRFGSLPSRIQDTLNSATLDQLNKWAERILDARSREEVFC